ncbi:MAG TPA: hypothetical protein VLD16_03265 [Gaiellaceae bacterium]|nr:hypothetical protein [Gaiellaceae bacterium]
MEVEHTIGYAVADVSGAPLGHVESPLYGTGPDHADAVAVRSDGLLHRHFIVPKTAIAAVDDVRHVLALSLERRQLTRFL